MSDTYIPDNKEIESQQSSIDEVAVAMFEGVQQNLLSFARGERSDFSAVFVSGPNEWMTARGSDRVHGLALERFYAANNSRYLDHEGQRYICMTVADNDKSPYELVLKLQEFADDYGHVYQSIISS